MAMVSLSSARARAILLQARVEMRPGMRPPIAWGGQEAMHRAFAFYNETHDARPFTVGCRPCHIKVFNWLLDIAALDAKEVTL